MKNLNEFFNKKRSEILPYDHLLLMPTMLFQLHNEQFYFTQKKFKTKYSEKKN